MRFVTLLMLLVLVACAPNALPVPTAAPTTVVTHSLRVGLASNGKTYLPLYVAADRTAQHENLQIELVTFNGGAALMQALAGGSVDIGVTGLNSVVAAITAGQPFKVFYTGLSLADYQWFATPQVHSWDELRGRSLGVTGPGSLIELFSRIILKRHGLEAERDVQLVTVGNPPSALQALQGGKVDATVLTNPTAWQAEAGGFVRLGTLSTEGVDAYPQSVLVASQKTLEGRGDAVKALLRAQVRADRLIENDRATAPDALVRVVKFAPADAERTRDELSGKLNERGGLPATAMPFFWEVAVLAGDAAAPWPETEYLDRRYIDTFDQWAPPD